MAIYLPLLTALLLPQLLAAGLALWLTGRARATLAAATTAGFLGWSLYAAAMARGLAQASGVGTVLLMPLVGAALGTGAAGLLLAIRAARRRVARSAA